MSLRQWFFKNAFLPFLVIFIFTGMLVVAHFYWNRHLNQKTTDEAILNFKSLASLALNQKNQVLLEQGLNGLALHLNIDKIYLCHHDSIHVALPSASGSCPRQETFDRVFDLPNEGYQIFFSFNKMAQHRSEILFVSLFSLVLLVVILTMNRLRKKLVENLIEPFSQKDNSKVSEIYEVQESIHNRQKYEELLKQNASTQALGEVSRQVAHDIRSPLTALNLVLSSSLDLPEEKRVLVRNAVQRINDIANSLLERSKKQLVDSTCSPVNSASSQQEASVQLLPTLVDSIVSEKRIQFRDKMNVQLDADLSQSYGLFVSIRATDFQRVLSNLINNAVEALPQHKGEVRVALRGYSSAVV